MLFSSLDYGPINIVFFLSLLIIMIIIIKFFFFFRFFTLIVTGSFHRNPSDSKWPQLFRILQRQTQQYYGLEKSQFFRFFRIVSWVSTMISITVNFMFQKFSLSGKVQIFYLVFHFPYTHTHFVLCWNSDVH